MIVLPYRSKNPPEAFPYCTVALIAANVVVFLLTTSHWQVTDGALFRFAESHRTFSVIHLFTSLFIHANLLHIGGNMLFLWLFGAAVEGRLGWVKFLIIYFAAGITGGWLMDVFFGAQNPDVFVFGASGAIMGVAGAYLFMFPFARIRTAWWVLFKVGVADWLAYWLIAFYVGMDIVDGYFFGANDSVADVAHLSGFVLGYLLAALFRPRMDGSKSSEVKSSLADLKDVTLLSLRELEVLMREPQPPVGVVLAYCERCRHEADDDWAVRMMLAARRNLARLVDGAEPGRVARLVLQAPPDVPVQIPGAAYLRLGSRLERDSEFELARQMYRQLREVCAEGRDDEAALLRLARIAEHVDNDPAAAVALCRELLNRYPTGSLALDAQDMVDRIASTVSPVPPMHRPAARISDAAQAEEAPVAALEESAQPQVQQARTGPSPDL